MRDLIYNVSYVREQKLWCVSNEVNAARPLESVRRNKLWIPLIDYILDGIHVKKFLWFPSSSPFKVFSYDFITSTVLLPFGNIHVLVLYLYFMTKSSLIFGILFLISQCTGFTFWGHFLYGSHYI